MYRPIQIDRTNLTIMGVRFPDLAALESTAAALGSNMFEGFEPTEGRVALIRDYILNKITFRQFIEAAKSVTHA